MSHQTDATDRQAPRQQCKSYLVGGGGRCLGVIERTKFLNKWKRCGQYDGLLWDVVPHESIISSSLREPHPELHPHDVLPDDPELSQPCWVVTKLSVSHT